MINKILLIKNFACAAALVLLLAGNAHAGLVLNFTEVNAEAATVDVGTLSTVTEPADQTVITSLSYTVSGLTIDADGADNDTATFTINFGATETGNNINWDVTTVSEFDYNGGTFSGTEGITFGAITVSGTGSGGQGYTLDSALYKEWTVRRFGGTDTMSVVGDVTGTQNLVGSDTNSATLNDTTFTATAGVGTWNGLNVDFAVEVSSLSAVPEPSSLTLVATGLGSIVFRRRRLK